MDNITSILNIWLNGIRNGNQGCAIVENPQVDLEPSRVQKRNLGAFPDRVVEDAAIRVPKVVTKGRNRDRADRDPDHDRTNPDRDHLARIHDHIVRGLEIALDRATVGNLQVDPFRGGEQEQGQDRTLRQSARTNLADQSQVLEHVALNPDENRDPKVAQSLITRIVTGGTDAVIDRLPSK